MSESERAEAGRTLCISGRLMLSLILFVLNPFPAIHGAEEEFRLSAVGMEATISAENAAVTELLVWGKPGVISKGKPEDRGCVFGENRKWKLEKDPTKIGFEHGNSSNEIVTLKLEDLKAWGGADCWIQYRLEPNPNPENMNAFNLGSFNMEIVLKGSRKIEPPPIRYIFDLEIVEGQIPYVQAKRVIDQNGLSKSPSPDKWQLKERSLLYRPLNPTQLDETIDVTGANHSDYFFLLPYSQTEFHNLTFRPESALIRLKSVEEHRMRVSLEDRLDPGRDQFKMGFAMTFTCDVKF